MKILTVRKDGGGLSRVWGFFLIEVKSLFTIALLLFKDGSREAYHSHAFNAVSWCIKGMLLEHNLDGSITRYTPSWRPIYTPRKRFHKVVSYGNTYVITFRGPWVDTWKEYLPDLKKFVKLTHGRKVVELE